MSILTGLLIVIEIIVSILLTLIILVQPSKSGGGLGGALGGGMSEQLFGARTGNVLTRATIVLSVIFLVNTVGLAMIYSRQTSLPDTAPIPGPQPGMQAERVQEMPAEENAGLEVDEPFPEMEIPE